jgi:hypothetical protein
MSTTSSATTTTINRLNAEILFWKSETDKRKVQLGEYTLLDDPSDPNDDLWEKLAACEVAQARERIAAGEVDAVALITELIRDKQACLVSNNSNFTDDRYIDGYYYYF